MQKIILIDNYDSFTYNVAQYFWELGYSLEVYRNDEISIKDIEDKKPSHLVISPGPATPNEAGISLKALEHFHQKLPILGICLGHQCIGQFFGGQIVRAPLPMHGKISKINHLSKGLFQDLPSPIEATRYHSLVLESCPDSLEVIARSHDDDLIMAIQHKTLPIYGIQFHPESIRTQYGHHMLDMFMKLTS